MKEKVEAFIRENGLLSRGDAVLVALSGGADSVALLSVLCELRPSLDLSVYAAHINHGIRGAEADADEAFVRTLCEGLGVSLFTEHLDIPALAREHSHTLEQEGRIARYDFLEKTRETLGARRIAVAHHMDDQAESILMHLIRGSGLTGLTGMKALRGNIIRPLLCVRRAQIESYLASRETLFCTDATNLLRDGTRNRIRLDVVPYVEKHINPGFTRSLCSTAALLSEDEEYLLTQARSSLDAAKTPTGYDRAALASLPSPIRSRALRLAFAAAGASVDIERKHIAIVEALLCSRTGAKASFPGAEVEVSYDEIRFFPPRGESDAHEAEIPFSYNGVTDTQSGAFIATPTRDTVVSADPFVAFMDADALPAGLTVRRRLPGDRFFPLGAPGTRKLKEYFIDIKLPREAREMPLIVSGKDVLFVPGCRIAETVKVTEKTSQVLWVEYIQKPIF